MTIAGSVCANDHRVAVPRKPRDGVDRALREALAAGLRGAGDHAVAGLIHGHETFRRPGGPAAWIRRLRHLRQEMPDRVADLEALAVHIMSCPPELSDSDR